jgi:hypothetical protein
VSLIDDRLICDTCGGYRVPFKSTLSSRCKCADYHPVKPGRHQIGAPVGHTTASLKFTRGGPDA